MSMMYQLFMKQRQNLISDFFKNIVCYPDIALFWFAMNQ